MSKPTPIPDSLSSLAFLVADKVSAMLAYWDQNLVCRYANASYLDWFGKTREEMVNRVTLQELLGPIFEKNLLFILGALKGEIQTFEREIRIPNGELRNSLATYYPNVVGGQVMGFFVHVADITPVKLLEKEVLLTNHTIKEQNDELLARTEIITRKTEELKSANDDLVAMNEELRASNEKLVFLNDELTKAKDIIDRRTKDLQVALQKEKDLVALKSELISYVSHEFRTPLSSVFMGIDFILKYQKNLAVHQVEAKPTCQIRS